MRQDKTFFLSRLHEICDLAQQCNIDISELLYEILAARTRTTSCLCSDIRTMSCLKVIDKKVDHMIEILINQSKSENTMIPYHNEQSIKQMTNFRTFREDIHNLHEWLANAHILTIVDPYFYSFDKSKIYPSRDAYIQALRELLPTGIWKLEVFHLPGPNKRIHEGIEIFTQKHNIMLYNYPTTEIHDRVWIKDYEHSMLIGTSFGGFGNKISFMIPLPMNDLRMFLKELVRIRQS